MEGAILAISPEYPFMQVAALATSQELGEEKNHKPWMQIAIDCPDANSPVLFDHSYYNAPRPISPQKAISHLLGYLQFAPPGGTVRVLEPVYDVLRMWYRFEDESISVSERHQSRAV